MESKNNNEEIIKTKWKKSVLEDVINYCTSNEFKIEINKFKKKNIIYFNNYCELKYPEEEEHSLECNEIFQEYQLLIENLLEEYVKNSGSTITDFYYECQSSLNGDFTALFEEHEHKWFVDALLAWLDYNVFFNDMVETARYSHK